MQLSACIITKNEQDRIAQCIRSVLFCNEIIVVDSNSTDNTTEIARSLGATVIIQDWLGYGAQKEFCIRQANNQWVLCLDADEYVSDELRIEIQQLQQSGFRGAVGYSMPRLTKYEGVWIRHGTWYPDRVVRLFNKQHGRWSDSVVHEHVELDALPKPLNNNLLHEGYRNDIEHREKTEQYARLMAEELFNKGKRGSFTATIVRAALAFVKSLLLRLGFMDGWRGWKLAWMTAWYTYRKYQLLHYLNGRNATQNELNK